MTMPTSPACQQQSRAQQPKAAIQHTLFSDAYVIETGKRAVVGDDTGLGLVLTLTDAKGNAHTAEGDPLKLHYVCTLSDQLVGDYTIPAELLKR